MLRTKPVGLRGLYILFLVLRYNFGYRKNDNVYKCVFSHIPEEQRLTLEHARFCFAIAQPSAIVNQWQVLLAF